MIEKYNHLISEIILNFVKRLYIEEGIEKNPDYSDFEIMDYHGIIQGPVEIWDRFLNIDDILICEANNFTAKSLMQFTDIELDLYFENKKMIANYYNYAKYTLNPTQYIKNENESLKRSEEDVKFAKEELEKTILNHNK